MLARFFLLALLISMLLPSGKAIADSAPFPVVAPWTGKYERVANAVTRNDGATPAEQDAQPPQPPDSDPAKNPPALPFPPPARAKAGVAPASDAAPSGVESMYSRRAGGAMSQFGYDLFGVPTGETQQKLDGLASGNSQPPMGEVQDDIILNEGDELEIVFTGQRSDRTLSKVDSRGLLVITDLPPIPAAGRSIGQVRISVEAAAKNLHNTQAYVSLSSVRQIGVLVVGHVRRPGLKTLTVFHTVLDALMESGGVDKSGSLRQIKLVRDGRGAVVDLYDLLLHGDSNVDLRLRDGDRIIIPPVGPTVAIAGEIKRPGIYELLPALNGMLYRPEGKGEKLSLNEMLELGGGAMAPGGNRFLKLEVTPKGDEKAEDVTEPFAPVFGDGSILMVSRGDERRSGTVELRGDTRRPGLHALKETPTLGKLINSADVPGPDAYPLMGVIERHDADQLTTQLIDFSLRLVLKGDYDRKLVDGDIVHLFSLQQIRELGKPAPDNAAAKKKPAYDMDAKNAAKDNEAETSNEISPELAAFLKERAVFVRGAAREPGAYPASEGTSLESLLTAAGGLSLEADASNIEVTAAGSKGAGPLRSRVNLADTNAKDVTVGPGYAVRINQKFQPAGDKSVLVMGEVRSPGHYDLLPGDKVSDLLLRAGGLSEQAYPDGAIFSRESERLAEEARFHAQGEDMKRAIAASLQTDDKKVDAAKIEEARALADELEHAQGVGRITIEADPATLKVKPELDMLLEPGDRLYIPRRALTVRVLGEVLSPASLQFRDNKKPMDYIRQAGGFAFDADKDRTFVLYPDGSAQPLQVSAWNYDPVFIPPGSAIVVPRDPKPFDFLESAKDFSQILSNLAVTAIFVNDVRNNN